MVVSIILSALCVVFIGVAHFFRINDSFVFFVVCKGLASLSFATLAFFSYKKNKKKSEKFCKVGAFILVGIVISLIADIIIELRFVVGFYFFITAQLLYFIAVMTHGKIKLKNALLLLIPLVSVLLIDFALPFFDFKDLSLPVIFYTCVWACIFAKSLDTFMLKHIQAKLMTIGILCFGISDFLLQFWVFPAANFPQNISSIIFIFSNYMYYLGQLGIAYSLSKDYIIERL